MNSNFTINHIASIIIFSVFCTITASSGIDSATDSLESTGLPTHLRHITTASPLGPFGCTIEASVNYGVDPALVRGKNGEMTINSINGHSLAPGLQQMISSEIDLRFGVHHLVDVSLSLPWYSDIAGWGETRHMIGDLALGGIYFLPLPVENPLQAGIRAEVVLPTGNVENSLFPREIYYLRADPLNPGGRNVTFQENRIYLHPRLLASLDLQKLIDLLPLTVHLNTGFITTTSRESFTVDAALGIALRPVSFFQMAAEIAGQLRPMAKDRSALDAFGDDPIRCVPSAAVSLPGGFTVLLAGEFGLASGAVASRMNWHRNYVYSTKALPQYGVSIALIYQGRIGKPGIKEVTGTAVTMPMEMKETVNTGDRDRDGIPDSLDRCPETPEDLDAFSNDDGCPDYDNDSDGVVDELDGCPDNPEDKDGFEDNDGCPDDDNDADKVPDSIDACPLEAGSEGNRGCPENGDLTFVRTVLTAVAFEPNKTKIVSGYEVLDHIAQSMIENPKAMVEIQVHTDNRGTSVANSTLSKNRAEVIKLYLISKGIRAGRITALGLGSEFPIADNSTDEGRAKNQRVEIRRIE